MADTRDLGRATRARRAEKRAARKARLSEPGKTYYTICCEAGDYVMAAFRAADPTTPSA